MATKLVPGAVLVVEDIVAALGEPTRVVYGAKIYEFHGLRGTVEVRASGRKDLPYQLRIFAPNAREYDHVLGRLQV